MLNRLVFKWHRKNICVTKSLYVCKCPIQRLWLELLHMNPFVGDPDMAIYNE